MNLCEYKKPGKKNQSGSGVGCGQGARRYSPTTGQWLCVDHYYTVHPEKDPKNAEDS